MPSTKFQLTETDGLVWKKRHGFTMVDRDAAVTVAYGDEEISQFYALLDKT
jgi:hypothetical protein